MRTYSELKFRAKGVLIGSFFKCIIAVLLLNLVMSLPSLFIPFSDIPDMQAVSEAELIKIEHAVINNLEFVMSILLGIFLIFLLSVIFIFSPLGVGKARFFNKAVEGETKLKNLFYAFINGAGTYFNILKVTFMKNLFMALWTVLGIIPFFAYLFFGNNIYALTVLILPVIILPLYKSYQYLMTDYITAENPDIKWREALKRSKAMMRGKIFYTLGLKLSFIGWYIIAMFFGPIGLIFVTPYVELTFSTLYFELKAQED